MKSYGITDKGVVRELNEDYCFEAIEALGNLKNLFVVADGMGGANAGEVASQMAVDEFVYYIKVMTTEEDSVEKTILNAIKYANNKVYNLSLSDIHYGGMGTTFAACTVVDNKMIIANIGDSRVYTVKDELKQISVDHSLVEEMVQSGEITREQSRNHPERNKITRALGVMAEVEADLFEVETDLVRKILLCSDGLTNMLDEQRIFEIVTNNKDIEEQGQQLVQESKALGGKDNITAIIVDLEN